MGRRLKNLTRWSNSNDMGPPSEWQRTGNFVAGAGMDIFQYPRRPSTWDHMFMRHQCPMTLASTGDVHHRRSPGGTSGRDKELLDALGWVRRSVPEVGLEPTRPYRTMDFESIASAIPPLRHEWRQFYDRSEVLARTPPSVSAFIPPRCKNTHRTDLKALA